MRAGIPTQKELRMAGRVDLVHAIQKWGGVSAVSKLTGLPRATTCAPLHWLCLCLTVTHYSSLLCTARDPREL